MVFCPSSSPWWTVPGMIYVSSRNGRAGQTYSVFISPLSRAFADNTFRRFIIPPPTCRINHPRPTITDVLTSGARVIAFTRKFSTRRESLPPPPPHRRLLFRNSRCPAQSFRTASRVIPRLRRSTCVIFGNGVTWKLYDAPSYTECPRNRSISSSLRKTLKFAFRRKSNRHFYLIPKIKLIL